MAYALTDRAPGASDLTAKNRVWGIFANPSRTRPENRRQPQQPRREIRPTATKPASGIPYWPSRDPIGERGGVNLYGFVKNDGVRRIDLLGMSPDFPDCCAEERKKEEEAEKEKDEAEKNKDNDERSAKSAWSAAEKAYVALGIASATAAASCTRAAITNAPWDWYACYTTSSAAGGALGASLFYTDEAVAADLKAGISRGIFMDKMSKHLEAIIAHTDCIAELDPKCECREAYDPPYQLP